MGDYIYENPPRRGLPRRHAGGEPADLAGYRARHAQYKTDRDLQAAHASHPFVVAWDDHEVENDYAGRHPVEGGDPAAFLRRRAAAYRAYWEHLPLRRPPRGATMPLYRRLRFGDLAELNLLDTRQYRDDQPCDEGGRGGGRVVTCPERVDPRRTILGDHQRRWLLRGLDRSQARWNVLAQQVVMAPAGPAPRSWPVLVERRMGRLCGRPRAHPPVPLGAPAGQPGRAHRRHPRLPGQRPAAARPRGPGPGGRHRAGRDLDQLRRQQEQRLPPAPRDNPHVRFFESRLRGYTRCTVIRERWYADLRVVDTVERPGAPVRTLASWVVENRRPGAEQV